MLIWRWDQGRLDYFRFENIVNIARVLTALDGVDLTSKHDLIRLPLESGTGLPFSPSHYKVWRNYGRVFACSMLAAKVSGKLFVTELCKSLAATPSELTSDQYFNFIFSRFKLPYPAFEDYDPKQVAVFPFVAIAKFVFTHPDGVSLEDVFAYVVGNGCTGLEDLTHYTKLTPTGRRPFGDEQRQVREMMVFMGQVSYLKWFDKKLYADSDEISTILKAITPLTIPRRELPIEEFVLLTTIGGEREQKKFEVVLKNREQTPMEFEEGKRVFGTHGRLERSPLVRRHFFRAHPQLICDACSMDVKVRYPWTDNILELHHILPLSATINVNGTTTLLADLVPLCPSCHKSIHIYYRKKLAAWGVEDFGSKKMARDVYDMAKREIAV